ncbi:MAG: hypothetical protein EOP91_06685 [Lysobacteraceae bacterium]|nr:MAG: hypothetical protein EOP91_06685 [Xanthomonadaceae bacterium]
MQKWILGVAFTAALLAAGAASAQAVHKCAKGGEVSYQSAPCDASQRTVRRWEAAPEPQPTDPPRTDQARRNKLEPARVPAASKPRATARRHSASPASPADKRCAAAKARRRAKLEAVGLKRNFDLLRKLDDAVHAACSGSA